MSAYPTSGAPSGARSTDAHGTLLGVPSGADVAEAMERCGLDVIARSSFRVVARDSRVTIYAVQYPRGWRISNAQHHPTRAGFCKTLRDVEHFCDETTLERAGVR